MTEDTTMAEPVQGEPIEYLVSRRSRRSTAGNRMEAALAEMALDTNMETVEDDQDFVNEKDEEDVFGSDFASTDEEEMQDEEEAGDRAAREEEARSRKDERSRLEKAAAAAHARQKLTFNPQAEASTSREKPKEPKKRVSLGVAFDAETRQIFPVDKSSPKKKRHSQRKHTVMNTTAAVERLKRSEEKKASMPRKMKVESKMYSQAELIALALDNEEGNIVDHRDYLKVEEEKRRRARVVRASIEGPLVRWISLREDEKVVIPPPPAPTVPSTQRFAYTPYAMGSLPYSQMTPYTYSAGVYPHMAGYMSSYSVPNTASTSVISGLGSGTPPSFQSSTPLKPPPAPSTGKVTLHQTTKKTVQSTQIVAEPVTEPTSVPAASQNAPTGTTSTTTQSTAKSTPPPPATDAMPQVASQSTLKPVPQQATQPPSQNTSSATTHYNPYMAHLQSTTAMKWTPPPAPTPTERIEKVAKSYVVHELAQDTSAPKPSWNETMSAMFGDDIKWDEIKVYSGKNRPLSRPKQICPITGYEAKYLDPRTGVPYADVRAYEVLTKLLAHEYAWHPSFGCYVGQDEAGANRAMSES